MTLDQLETRLGRYPILATIVIPSAIAAVSGLVNLVVEYRTPWFAAAQDSAPAPIMTPYDPTSTGRPIKARSSVELFTMPFSGIDESDTSNHRSR